MIWAIQHDHPDYSCVRVLVGVLERLQSHDTSLREIGLASITFSKFVIEAYVPNIPLDPLVAQQCAIRFWKDAEEQMQSQLELHVQHEKRLSGNTSNAVIHFLEARLRDIREGLEAASTGRHWDRGIGRLGMYWSEVSKFVSQVLLTFNDYSAPSVDPIARESIQREEMFQDSLSGFCQRLETAYPEYHDISAPVVWAVLHMKLGVRLAFTQLPSSPHTIALSQALVFVPSILEMNNFINATVGHQTDNSPSINIGLSAIALEKIGRAHV